MEITARFESNCGSCGKALEVGETVEWYPNVDRRKAYCGGEAREACAAAVLARVEAEAKAEAEARELARQEFLATPCARPSEDLGSREYSEAWAEYNSVHGFCPDGCCGAPKDCGREGCAYKGCDGSEPI